MTLAERERAAALLLALLGHREVAVKADAPVWQDAARLARQQRLGPQCHGALARRPDVNVPGERRHEWSAAYRANGMAILAQRHALAAALAVLTAAGIEAVALKGAALAWTVWPSPAERVMRDIDLLVAPADAPRAYRLLRAAGWSGPDPADALLDRMAADETHLPPLLSPAGVVLELHGHVWRSAPVPGSTMPPCDSAAVMARAQHDARAGVRVPAPADMLAHLVVHGARAHLFNVGPVLLADVDFLIRRGGIDWPAFWHAAERRGFVRAAALVLALTARWRRPDLLEQARCPLFPPDEQIDEAQQLLFQSPRARKDINLIAGLAAAPISAHRRLDPHPLDAAQEPGAGGLTRLGRRGGALLRGLAHRPTRSDGLSAGALARWLAD